jgi:hypothetical protein
MDRAAVLTVTAASASMRRVMWVMIVFLVPDCLEWWTYSLKKRGNQSLIAALSMHNGVKPIHFTP